MTDYAAALCGRMNPKSATAYVLTGTDKYMEPRTLQYHMEKFAHDCGLEGVHFHILRHTFATRAVEVGFEIKSLSEVLGHASTICPFFHGAEAGQYEQAGSRRLLMCAVKLLCHLPGAVRKTQYFPVLDGTF